MASSAADQCRAITADGERCGHPAQEDGFCHQHDESDETVSDTMGDTNDADDTSGTDTAEESGGDESGGENLGSDILDVRDAVWSIGHDLIGDEIDGIIGVSRDDDGWRATVEVVERKSVPDTQDILGRYEIDLDSNRSVSGYRRIDRYRRADTDHDDFRE